MASMPLIMMLRHILTAEDTPNLSLATFALKPSSLISGASSAAPGPPSSSGTLIRYGGTEVMTAPSTYRPPPQLTSFAARCFAAGEAELKSRNQAPFFSAGAQACATDTVSLAVTADTM